MDRVAIRRLIDSLESRYHASPPGRSHMKPLSASDILGKHQNMWALFSYRVFFLAVVNLAELLLPARIIFSREPYINTNQ